MEKCESQLFSKADEKDRLQKKVNDISCDMFMVLLCIKLSCCLECININASSKINMAESEDENLLCVD